MTLFKSGEANGDEQLGGVAGVVVGLLIAGFATLICFSIPLRLDNLSGWRERAYVMVLSLSPAGTVCLAALIALRMRKRRFSAGMFVAAGVAFLLGSFCAFS